MMKTKLAIVTAVIALCAMGTTLLTPHYAAAEDKKTPAKSEGLQCSILPSDFCKAADKDLGKDTQANSKNSAVFMILQWALAILTGGVVIAAIAAFVWAGIMYSSAGGSADMVKKAKDIITQTVIGLVLFAALALLLTWLIPGGVF